MMSYLPKISVVVLFSLVVAACGGGGGSGGTNNNVSSTSSSSSSVAVAKIDQQPLFFSVDVLDLFIDNAPFVNPLEGGSGAGEIGFASDNPDVVTVDQTGGEVTIVGEGSATISVTKSADDIYNATTATYTVTVSKNDQDPLVFELENIQAVLNGPMTNNSLSGGSGSGAINYEIGDSTIAAIDSTTGTVSVFTLGVTTVTATKASDGVYKSTSTSYALNVVEILSGLEILVGLSETKIKWDAQIGTVDLVRTTNPDCDIDKIYLCANRRLTTISSPVQTPVSDTYIRTTRPAYLVFQNETYRSNPVDVRVVPVPFSRRAVGKMISFRGKLWIIGGLDYEAGSSNTDLIRYNDIWSSDDGISWTPETNHAAFSPRASIEVVEFRNELYLIGGHEGSRSDVWKSSDGVSWQEISPAAPFEDAYSAKFIEFDDKLWAIGGSLWKGYTGIWSTVNGIDWIEENANAPFGPREGHALYVVNNLLMLFGGRTLGDSYFMNDVWSSPDGINWQREASNTAVTPRAGMQVQNLNGTLWLTGGHSLFSDHNDAYSSTDGIKWTLTATSIISPNSKEQALTLHNSALWILSDLGGNFLWKSYDGKRWGIPLDPSTSWDVRQKNY